MAWITTKLENEQYEEILQLKAQLEELVKREEFLQELSQGHIEMVEKLQSQLSEARAEVEGLRKALGKYGEHLSDKGESLSENS